MSSLPSFVRFGLVGTLGFLVDGGLLQALVDLAGWGVIQARLLSFPAAVFATWLLNRNFTFDQANDGAAGHSFARYVAVSLGGASINFIIYTALVLSVAPMAAFPIMPLAIASIVALAFNYLGSKHFAFR
ncbi:GtrA family protein [Polaromonas sp.]|uniref:GtrA family protein n=1 Tax=Polaromonas sp. TaxID=1869339 RepID=UPI00184CBF71|nr:GtrA family protein [Polaromonas sp.]NMM06970.1 GtrA family protein [Polaromonas sp.]